MQYENILVFLPSVDLVVPGKCACDFRALFLRNSKPKPLLSYSLRKEKEVIVSVRVCLAINEYRQMI